mmetsp:Transcript_19697/g.39987  ORF Transcript_19697/g.39987 Transcript_19697/m.39987 type:complete len:96 (+) Transcript_19697:269-556(+)
MTTTVRPAPPVAAMTAVTRQEVTAAGGRHCEIALMTAAIDRIAEALNGLQMTTASCTGMMEKTSRVAATKTLSAAGRRGRGRPSPVVGICAKIQN